MRILLFAFILVLIPIVFVHYALLLLALKAIEKLEHTEDLPGHEEEDDVHILMPYRKEF